MSAIQQPQNAPFLMPSSWVLAASLAVGLLFIGVGGVMGGLLIDHRFTWLTGLIPAAIGGLVIYKGYSHSKKVGEEEELAAAKAWYEAQAKPPFPPSLIRKELGYILQKLINDGTLLEEWLVHRGKSIDWRATLEKWTQFDPKERDRILLNVSLLRYAGTQEAGIVQFLLALGADPNYQDVGEYPLHLAVRSGSYEVAKLLLEGGADANQRARDRSSPLSMIRIHDTRMVELLLQHNANPNTALKKACQEGAAGTVQLLLAKGADAKVIDQNGQTLLFTLCRHCLPLREREREQILEALLKAGANPCQTNQYGHTALIDTQNPYMIDLLLMAGCPCNYNSLPPRVQEVFQKSWLGDKYLHLMNPHVSKDESERRWKEKLRSTQEKFQRQWDKKVFERTRELEHHVTAIDRGAGMNPESMARDEYASDWNHQWWSFLT